MEDYEVRDAFGSPINIGDRVLHACGTGPNMIFTYGVVTDFSDDMKFVKIDKMQSSCRVLRKLDRGYAPHKLVNLGALV